MHKSQHTEHTSEPWRYNKRDNPNHDIVKAAPLTVYHDETASVGSGGEVVIADFLKEADVVHACACVNALAGLTPEAMPRLVAEAERGLEVLASGEYDDGAHPLVADVMHGLRTALAEISTPTGPTRAELLACCRALLALADDMDAEEECTITPTGSFVPLRTTITADAHDNLKVALDDIRRVVAKAGKA